MDSFLVLLAILVVVGGPAALIYLIISHSLLKTRVATMEARLELLQRRAPAADRLETAREIPPTQEEKPAPGIEPEAPPAEEETPAPPLPGPVPATARIPEEAPPPGPPPVYVFRPETIEAFTRWMQQNWFYAVAAVSLALAGIFLVQYGIENGILTPPMRVAAAIIFGIALIAVAEVIRRRSGDEEDSHTAYLPSIFAGAGLVSMFGGVLAARGLYGLIGPDAAFFWLAVVGIIAVVLGWFYGPVLAVVGVLGATAAPFLVGGDSANAWLLFYYFAVIAVAGLSIDSVKRWAWLSSLSLVFTFAAASLIWLDTSEALHYAGFSLIVTAASVIIPERSLWPRHQGTRIFQPIADFYTGATAKAWPEFPARLVGGTVISTLAIAILIAMDGQGEFWLAIAVVSILLLATVFWFDDAPALESLILLPPLVLLYLIGAEGNVRGAVYDAFRQGIMREPETMWPLDASKLLAIAAVGSMVLAIKAWKGTPLSSLWSASAAILAPTAAILLELYWRPADVIGVGEWSFHAIAVAVLMTGLAERTARREGPSLGVALFVIGALVMISLALVLLLTKTALTLALAVMVVVAAGLDRRFDLKPLTWFVQLGGAVVGWRLLITPGLPWALDAPLWEMTLSFTVTVVLFAFAWNMLLFRNRIGALVVMESAVWTLSGILATLLIYRIIAERATSDTEFSHWAFGLYAVIWMLSCGNQLWRIRAGGPLRTTRIVLASLTGALAVLMLGIGLTLVNPLFMSFEPVSGPPVLNTLVIAYALPALVLAVGVIKLDHLPRWLLRTLTAAGAVLGIVYVGLAIRHAWHGPILDLPGVKDGEQYSYTIAMLIGSAGLLFLAFNRRSGGLRRVALVGIGLTIAKVFLIDMSGLQGLLRVFSFLALGLALAGLAWINRWMVAKLEEEAGDTAGPKGGAPV